MVYRRVHFRGLGSVVLRTARIRIIPHRLVSLHVENTHAPTLDVDTVLREEAQGSRI